MKKLIFIFLFIPSLLFSQNVYYVATTGNDITGNGTIGNPWLTVQKAVDATTTPGDTVFFRGGTYAFSQRATINPEQSHGANGVYANPIVFMSYPGEWAVFDLKDNCSIPGNSYNSFININYAEHIEFRNFEVKNVFQCIGVNSGVFNWSYSRNLEFYNLRIHDISAPRGFSGGGGAWETWQAGSFWNSSVDTTRFINIDVYNTCDTLGGGNAGDGWKGQWYGNNYVEWIGCRTWNFSDDGHDNNNIDGATFVLKNNWTMSTKKYEQFDIEGNGFKHTAMYAENSVQPSDYHFIQFKNNIIVGNNYTGMYDNLYSYMVNLNTYAFGNVMFNNKYGISPRPTSTYRNNIAYNAITVPYPSTSIGTNNTWNTSDYSDSIAYDPWDYLSIDLNEITRPRKADGSLPNVDLFKLRTGSHLIDAGTYPKAADDITMTVDSAGFAAITPDIGAWEYVTTTGVTKKRILSFTFPNQSGYSVYDTINHTVTAKIYYANRATLSALVPVVLPSDRDTISPGFLTTVDFSNPVVYNVSPITDLADIQAWTLTITADTPVKYANVRSFYMNNYVSSIDTSTNTVYNYYPAGSNISSLTPTVSIDRGATSNLASITPHNFNNGNLNFTVVAEDEVTTKYWTASVAEMTSSVTFPYLGYNIIFPSPWTTARIGYCHYTAYQDGYLKSLSIYHNGGVNNVLMGIYSNNVTTNDPETRLGITAATAVNNNAGWQTINLIDSVSVTSGQKIWIAYVFETNPGFRILDAYYDQLKMAHLDNYGYGYAYGLRATAPTAGGWNYLASVYATYDVTIPVASITVTGAGNATTITTNDGTLQMSAAILPVDATLQTVTWSIADGTGHGHISVGGLVTAVTDGTATATATADDGSAVHGHLELTFSNQDDITIPVVPTTALPLATNIRVGASGGNVTGDGGATVTDRGICWNTSTNPTTANAHVHASGTTGGFTSAITGLVSNTTYYVRSWATNSIGTSYGPNETFKTPYSSTAGSASKIYVHNGKTIVLR
jgi:hypothetical protein